MTIQPLKYLVIVWLALMAALSSDLQAQAICEPDTTLDSLGVYPSVPPQATVGELYNVTLDAAIPKELTVPFQGNQITLDICAARITGTDTLEDIGLTYECNVADCDIDIDHSDGNPFAFACIVVDGTPTTEVDSIKVLMRVGLGNYSADTDQCNVNLSLDTSLVVGLVVSATTNLGEAPAADFVWRYDAAQQQITLQRSAATSAAELSIMNLQGQTLVREGLGASQAQRQFSTAHWPAGIYLLRLRDASGAVQTRKVRIQ